MGYLPRDFRVTATKPISSRAVVWEETNCLLCDSRRWHTLLEAPDRQGGSGLWFAVVQCQDCGLCFTNPRPHRSQLHRFYPADYRPHQVFRETKRKLHRFWERRPPLRWHGQGRLLDFGCGGGNFLVRMRARGWQVTGLDIAAPTVQRVRAETGLRVLVGSLPHPELQPASFDVLTMWHSLEHVPEPKAVLREARRLLAPGGKLLVAVPNIDSLAFRLFGEAWFGLDLPRHLTHFTPWTLHVLLERTGFHVERIRMVRHSSWLRHSAAIACQRPHVPTWPRWLRKRWPSRLIALYSCLTGQADCILATAVVHTSNND